VAAPLPPLSTAKTPIPMQSPDEPACDRRAFLLGAAIPFAAAAPAHVPVSAVGDARDDGAVEAPGRPVAPPPPRDDADDMAAAARLAGLELTADERALAVGRLRRQRDGYQTVRGEPIPFELPPCATFDPWPPGVPRPNATPRVVFAVPRDAAVPATDADLAFAPVPVLASLLRQRAVTSERLVTLALDRLARFDPLLHCVVTLLREPAVARARALDAELAAGTDRGPLHGIPYGAKDLFGWPGAPTTFGAAPWRDHVWNVEATCLRRLHDAGAVLVAKLALGALAMGDLWHGGRTRNPFDPDKGSSGSSAGPAAAVAAGLVPFAIGTETLGSIVSPCRQCGVAGLRPTFGTVSRHGAMPLSWTMDKVGPIARTAVDAALVFDAMRGADGKDPAAVDAPFPWRPGRGVKGLRIGVLQQRDWPRRAEDEAFVAWVVAQSGTAAVPVTLPAAPYDALLAMLHAEAAAAFDEATRTGLLPRLPGQGENDWPNQFRAARTIPAVEYLQASRARSRLCARMHEALAGVDVLVAPTHGGPTLVATNLSGHPTYVLPVGARDADGGRPTVLALVGQLYGEADLLAVGQAWQTATTHHRARPAAAR
jgi:Asp-tRNA(Asn)/Glu-tRNA(Gln) amidotransferase A subunit family amidase